MNFESAKRKIMKILRKDWRRVHIYNDQTFNDFVNTFHKEHLCWIGSNAFYVTEYSHDLRFVIEFHESVHLYGTGQQIDNIEKRARNLLREKICLLIVTESCPRNIFPACTKSPAQLLNILKDYRGYSTLGDMFREKLELPQAKDL